MGIAFFIDLAYAAGVAISPTPIVVVILMLFSATGRRNALAFLVGWVVGLAFLVLFIFAFLEKIASAIDSISIFGRPVIQILVGVGIIALGRRQWNKPPTTSADGAAPRWMARLDEFLKKSSDKFTPTRALLLAVVMSALSAKNIALTVALSLTLNQLSLQFDQDLGLILLFVILSSVTIGIPVLYSLVKGPDSQQALTEWKDWVISNRGRALALLLFILGAIAIFNAVIALLEQRVLAA